MTTQAIVKQENQTPVCYEPKQEVLRRPKADIYESDTAYLIWLNLPGIKQEDIELELGRDKMLILQASSSQEEGETALRYLRRFKISDDIDTSSIEAKLEKGVLHIRLNKKQEEQPFKIEIQ